MSNYTKLFNSIVTSTIWSEDDKTRIVWITMLAMADRHGEVSATLPGLARLAGVTLEAAELAIAKFLAPDKHSRTKDDEGRRIEEIEGGWLLLNHGKYRLLASTQDDMDKNAERQRRHRERLKRNGTVTDSNGTVTPKGGKAEAEADTKADEEKEKTPAPPASVPIQPPPPPPPPTEPPSKADLYAIAADKPWHNTWREWIDCRMDNRNKPKDWVRMFRKTFEKLCRYSNADAVAMMNDAICGNWQGLHEPKGTAAKGGQRESPEMKATETLKVF